VSTLKQRRFLDLMERLSRRIALQYQELMGHIIALEAEVAALKSSRSDALQQGDPRTVYQDAREIDWCAPLAAESAIARIMQQR
jgi:hypothetical protein